MKPRIEGNYLDDREDVEALVRGVRVAREIAHAGPFDAYRGEEIYPGPDFHTDAELEEYVRQRAELLYHPVGTVAMGRGDTPLDPQLRVRGVDGLRVIDASVMPQVTTGNTNAPTIMIGEKGADLLLSA